MSNIADLRDARAAACQRCEAATQEAYDAFTNLLGLDAAAATLSDAPVAFRIEGTPPSTRFVVDDMAEASSLYAPCTPRPPWGGITRQTGMLTSRPGAMPILPRLPKHRSNK
jgi:hypothetical protein